MRKALARIAEEESRARKYLNEESSEKVRLVCNEVLISNHQERLQVECEPMLKEDRIEDLKCMYTLLNRINDGIKFMLVALEQHIIDVGLEVIKAGSEGGEFMPKTKTQVKDAMQTEAADVYVEKLMKVYTQFRDIVDNAFGTNPYFVAALDKAYRVVVNENCVAKERSRSPELIARYSDIVLKKGNKHLDDAEIEAKLSDCILLFKYLNDRDVFRRYYSSTLTKRLLCGTSISDDAERSMIAKLKEVCGFEYVTKIQRMFNDIQLSDGVVEKFKEHLVATQNKFPIDMTAFVLTNGSWPFTGRRSTYKLPKELVPLKTVFEEFYVNHYNGRRLTWMYHLSQADVKMTYTKKKYEFQCNNYQLAVLLLFNEAGKWTLSDIRQQTALDDVEAQRTTMSLCEYKILRRVKEEEGDAFVLNENYVNKRIRFKVTSTMFAETKSENDATRKSISEDRKFFLQAVIVRIMKTRQRISFQELIQEVIAQSQARFQPNVRMIKECVETLVEKEYMARTEGGESYEYRA
eukprot:TRINITY_DN8825_c0_g1_i1.p1 TRINITY_DN8825_c0_g1~~TRINITY_DN8825_c0_g1_i1.p1  ORF type:complete len:521 (-),score=98.73 TRINITY_DN8825_c0_g1_i1:72-1634(-)